MDNIYKKRDDRTVEQKKADVLTELMNARAIKSIAYTKAGVKKGMFFKWQREDPVFAKEVLDIEDKWLDVVEDQLLQLISIGDRAAIMFYLKAKGKNRGYK